jgi:hypothetical protein
MALLNYNGIYHVVTWRPVVEVNAALLTELLLELRQLEQQNPPFHRFSDYSRVPSFTFTSVELRRIAELTAVYAGPSVKSAIFSSEPLGFGIGRMYQAFMAGSLIDVQVFREIDAAARWLGVPRNILTAP